MTEELTQPVIAIPLGLTPSSFTGEPGGAESEAVVVDGKAEYLALAEIGCVKKRRRRISGRAEQTGSR